MAGGNEGDARASKEPEGGKSFGSWFTLYDYAGFIVPETILLLGLIYFFPKVVDDQHTISVINGVTKDFGFAGLGMFIVIAYVAGQVVEGFTVLPEKLMWWLLRGRPGTWITRPQPLSNRQKFMWYVLGGPVLTWITSNQLLSGQQRTKLLEAINSRFGFGINV